MIFLSKRSLNKKQKVNSKFQKNDFRLEFGISNIGISKKL